MPPHNPTPFDIGDEVTPVEWAPTRELVLEMVELFDWLPWKAAGEGIPDRFTDEDAARRDGSASRVVPSNLGMMAIGMALQRWLPQGTVRKLDCIFRQPIIQGQHLTVSGVVTDRREEEVGIVLELDVYLMRQDGQRPQGGTAVVVLPSGG